MIKARRTTNPALYLPLFFRFGFKWMEISIGLESHGEDGTSAKDRAAGHLIAGLLLLKALRFTATRNRHKNSSRTFWENARDYWHVSTIHSAYHARRLYESYPEDRIHLSAAKRQQRRRAIRIMVDLTGDAFKHYDETLMILHRMPRVIRKASS